ncbi:MAG: copper chaperone PCu(A)C [Pseudomonas sp.]|jgi:copper(I)-binding protein
MRVLLSALLISGSFFSIPSLAYDYTAGDLHINHPWSRALPPVAPTGATYLTIENRGQQSDTLIGARTPVAGHTELHEHVHQNGLMKMQQIDSVEIAAGQSVEFRPGGHHVMLFDLKEPLVAGHDYPMTLIFERAGEVDVKVQVGESEPAVNQPAEQEHGHHHH